MDWENEHFVKVYTRDTGEWTMLTWDAQALLLQILRKVDRSGVLQLGKHGKRALPAALGHREHSDRILAALDELLSDGCVGLADDRIVVPNFIDAQKARMSDKLRQQRFRDARRDAAVSTITNVSQPVTKDNTESHDVTERHTTVTPRIDQTRIEEITPKPQDPPEPSQPIQLTMQGGVSSDKPNPAHVRKAIATSLFAELQQARRRCNPRVPRLDPKPLHLREIEGRLKDGLSVDELRSVICEVERRVKANTYSFDHFDHVSPFRASNVTKYTTASTPAPSAKDPSAPILPPDTRAQTQWLVDEIKREKAQREARNAAAEK